jgi:hypothetical protein
MTPVLTPHGLLTLRQTGEALERADLAMGSLAPGGMGDLGREEVTPGSGRRFGNPAAEFATLAVLADIAADRQAPLCAPERLEQAGGGPEPRIERLVDPMFLENVGWDEPTIGEGLPNSDTMLRAPMNTKQIQMMAAEIYGVR